MLSASFSGTSMSTWDSRSPTRAPTVSYRHGRSKKRLEYRGCRSRGLDDHIIAGYAVRTTSALEESGFYDRSGPVPGVGRGRKHGDVQHRERGFVAFASFCPSGAAGEDRR